LSRIGYLSNGGAWLSAYHDLLDVEMHAGPTVFDTSKRRLARFAAVDILVIPWAPDAVWIAAHRKKLIRFMAHGGLLIAFGEFESDWLPNMIWTKAIEDSVMITTGPLSPDGMRARRIIFEQLTDATLSNWSDTSHGSFRGLPADADVLATNITGNPVVVFDGRSTKGALLASSIDPDFHTYAKNDNAARMFRQIIRWALLHAAEEGGYRGREFRVPRRDELSRLIAPVLPTVAIEGAIAIIVATAVVLLWH
jgi:hypothetical protein